MKKLVRGLVLASLALAPLSTWSQPDSNLVETAMTSEQAAQAKLDLQKIKIHLEEQNTVRTGNNEPTNSGN